MAGGFRQWLGGPLRLASFIATPVYKTDPNLISLWLMEELIAGSLHRDAIGSNHLTDHNGVGHSADTREGRRSADFERGSSQYLSIADGDQFGLDITGSISFGCWTKPESTGIVHQLLTKWTPTGNQRSYLLQIGSSEQVSAYFSDDGTAEVQAYTANSVISADTWYHLVVVYGETDIRIYVDGALSPNGANNPKTFSTGIFNGTAQFMIGNRDGDTNYADGLIDEAFVFDRALSADEVLGIYQYGILDEAPGVATLDVATIPSLSPIFHIRQED